MDWLVVCADISQQFAAEVSGVCLFAQLTATAIG